MFNEDKFAQEFKKQNDSIKPSQEFKDRLSAMVEEESKAKVIPFYRDVKKMGTIAAALAVVVISGSILGINMSNSSKVNENNGVVAGAADNGGTADDAGASSDKSDSSSGLAGSYHFEAQAVDVNAVAQEIKDGAKVTADGNELEQAKADELADKLTTGNVLESSSDEEISVTYVISGTSTWAVEEYVTNDLYIYVK